MLRHAITAECMLRVESLMRATPAQHGTLGVGALRHTSVTQNVASAASVLQAKARLTAAKAADEVLSEALQSAANAVDASEHEHEVLGKWATAVAQNQEIELPAGWERHVLDFNDVPLEHLKFARRCRIRATDPVDYPP